MREEEKKLVHYSFECKVIKRKGVVREEENKAIEMLDKFITEHKLYNIKQSDGLEDNIKIALNLIAKREEEIENLKLKLAIYDSENRKLKHIVMSLPNGLETLQRL